MTEYKRQTFTGERALFASRGARIVDCTFKDGESPLKESRDLELNGAYFKWKYPLWYCENVTASDCVWFETARAGVWYSNGVRIRDTLIDAPKNFRRCRDLELNNVTFSHAAETLWTCEGVKLDRVVATGDYFGMNSRKLDVRCLTLYGNYGFDGAEDMIIRDSKLLTKDAFWNCRRVRVENSYISGEYLGWNSEDVTFVNCTIESLQGLCYIRDLKLVDCKLINTTLAFEYSSVDAVIDGSVDSVFNPSEGTIRASEIRELIVEPDRVDPAKTKIICTGAKA